MNSDHILNKRQLRASFERASAEYDKVSMLQREVNDRMLSRLDYIKCNPLSILDAGSGTGYGGRKLACRYPKTKILALDLALSMHHQARPMASSWWKQIFSAQKNITNYVCGDIEQLPIRGSSIDLIWSNLSLQWCNNIEDTFSEMYRVLKQEGLFMFSTFGPDTLHELRQAFLGMDDKNHVNHFIDMHDIGDILVYRGFSMPVMDMEYITLTYDDVISVMRELKAMGAHNVLHERKRGLTGKVGWQKVLNNYESFRKNGKLPVTFELVYGHAWKLESKKNTDGQNIIEFDPKARLVRD
ncbi:MAG: malonyl-[acyl-carrier protein] O-methyltransferase BioC [Nitrosomonadaceae bacterium]|nr:malonyl-[acyl-carrier protein] O-methyltransferase BioC [Nitrosomonadaceae bacterium]|tara:strand:+ start:571 stop:1467 length:897 start_codon:yes stop_codon:yes gene_type:complete